MSQFPIEHLRGCTPLTPCASCKAIAFLRTKLNEDDLLEFCKIMRTDLPRFEDDGVLSQSISMLELSVRSGNCLKNDNIYTIGDLVRKSETEILRTPNFGRRSLNEIKEALAKHSLTLGMIPK